MPFKTSILYKVISFINRSCRNCTFHSESNILKSIITNNIFWNISTIVIRLESVQPNIESNEEKK